VQTFAPGAASLSAQSLDPPQFGSGHLRAILTIKQTKHGTQTQREIQKGCGAHRADPLPAPLPGSRCAASMRGAGRQISADLGVGLSTLKKWVNAFSKKAMPAGPDHNLVDWSIRKSPVWDSH
jgi:hypothetical protein